jgi:glyoxylase-like metal-dependent hydrolase (beta-lactamase superfamily II)
VTAADDVEALVLTQAHFDHVGVAEKARTRLGIPVYAHENDAPLLRHPWRYDHERPRALYLATQVRALPDRGLLRAEPRALAVAGARGDPLRGAARCPCRARPR